eukprot:scaffold407_cov68-Cylindrotheca_fusiformis.AAC.1
MFNETHEYIKRLYPETTVFDTRGEFTTPAAQTRLEEERKGQKIQVAACRTRVADLERELHFAKKELEEAYRHYRPIEGEYYRLSKSPATIVKIVQVFEGDTNRSVARKFDQVDRKLTDDLIWDIADENVGHFVKRNTGSEPLPSTDSGGEEDYARYSTEEERPKKKRSKPDVSS